MIELWITITVMALILLAALMMLVFTLVKHIDRQDEMHIAMLNFDLDIIESSICICRLNEENQQSKEALARLREARRKILETIYGDFIKMRVRTDDQEIR